MDHSSTPCASALRQAVENNWSTEKIRLETSWSERFGLPYRQIQFSHLVESGGMLPSGVILGSDISTAYHGTHSGEVRSLRDLGEFMDGAVRPRHSSSPSWSFVERSGAAFWSMHEVATTTRTPEDPRLLLPKTLRDNAVLSQQGTLEGGNLVFSIEGSTMVIEHQFGIMFSLILEGGDRLDFSSDDTWRRVILYMAKSGRYAVDLAELERLCPPPHEDLNRELSDLIGVHPGLLAHCEWSGIPEHVLPLGDGWAILTDAEQRKFSLARDGAVVTREIKEIIDIQLPLMNSH